MREEGLSARAAAPAARPYSSYAGEEGMAGAPNLLLVDASRDLHDFSAGRPGERLVTDITEFRLPDDARKVYLSPVMIPSTFFSPIAQMNRHRSRQRIFTGSANGLSPFSAILRPSSRAAGPSAGRTCP